MDSPFKDDELMGAGSQDLDPRSDQLTLESYYLNRPK